MLCRYIKLLKEKPIYIRKENIAKSETTPLLPNGTLLIVCMHRKSAKRIKPLLVWVVPIHQIIKKILLPNTKIH